MVAAAPHREWRGHEGQLGVKEKGCTRGWWAGNSLHRAVGTALSAGAQGVFGQSSQTLGLNIGWSCVEPRVGLNDLCGSLSPRDVPFLYKYSYPFRGCDQGLSGVT